MKYKFGSFELNISSQQLLCDDMPLDIEPQVFDLLVYLAENAEKLVTQDDLIEAVWHGRIVSDSAISARISAARAAVRDSGSKQEVIKTVPRKGFRFIAEVEKIVDLNEKETLKTRSASAQKIPQNDKPSIAVLPFENISGDPEQEYFADGLSEDIITALSRFHWFFVVARNSSYVFKGQSIDVRDAATKLGVRYILEGSVRRAGNRIRVNAQFIDAISGNHIWAERYDRTLDDIFAIQDEITQSICGALEGALNIEEQRKARLLPPKNIDAWAEYHLGQNALTETNSAQTSTQTAALFHAALDHYQKSHELDPNFSRPLSAYAMAMRRAVIQGAIIGEAADQGIEKALAMCELAEKLDPQDGNHKAIHGTILGYRGDWNAALRHINEGIELNPNSAQSYLERGQVKSFGLWPEEALSDLEIAARLSPLDPILAIRYPIGSWALLRTKNYEQAAEWAALGMTANRGLFWPAIDAAAAYVGMNNIDRAKEMIGEAKRRKPDLSITFLRRNIGYLDDETFKEWFLECLRKSGLPD